MTKKKLGNLSDEKMSRQKFLQYLSDVVCKGVRPVRPLAGVAAWKGCGT